MSLLRVGFASTNVGNSSKETDCSQGQIRWFTLTTLLNCYGFRSALIIECESPMSHISRISKVRKWKVSQRMCIIWVSRITLLDPVVEKSRTFYSVLYFYPLPTADRSLDLLSWELQIVEMCHEKPIFVTKLSKYVFCSKIVVPGPFRPRFHRESAPDHLFSK